MSPSRGYHYESSGDETGPYTEKVPKWFRAFRADLKTLKNGDLLMLSNSNGGFNIIHSQTGIKGPWKDSAGNLLASEWANFDKTSVPDDNTQLPPPVYRFIDNGHCVKGWNGLTDASGNSLANEEYVTRTCGSSCTINDHFGKCTDAQKDTWNCHMADPAFVVKSDDSVIIAYRGTKCKCYTNCDKYGKDHTERLGLIHATTWNGPYSAQLQPIFADNPSNSPALPMDGGLEDLFMWVDATNGGVHMIVHSQARDHAHKCADGYDDGSGGVLYKGVNSPGNGCPTTESTFHHKKKRGAALFSADGLTNWKVSNWELFPSEIYQHDGKTRFLLKQQRPSLIFDANNNPTHLITGVDYLYDPCCDWFPYGSAWTLIQKVSQCKAGEIHAAGTCTKCTPTMVTTTHSAGTCNKATSKYGTCVCAECNAYHSGDACEIPPPYITSCKPLTHEKKCGGGIKKATKWFFKKDNTNKNWTPQECHDACEEYASHLGGKFGCCMSFETGPVGNCRFETGTGIAQGFMKTHAASCVRHLKNETPF